MHPVDLSDEALLAECDVQRTRRKGPGGQHRNKVETAVVLRHRGTGISAEANEKRSQAENRQQALFRLRLNLALGKRTPRGPGLSENLERRRRAGKLSVNPRHEEFPSLVAEVLDWLAIHEFQIPQTAAELGITGSQLLKFLKLWPPAFDWFNRQREVHHLPRLRF